MAVAKTEKAFYNDYGVETPDLNDVWLQAKVRECGLDCGLG